MGFASHFPLYCPPDAARPANHTVYRFFDKLPPKLKELRSHKERDLEREVTEEYDDECDYCSVSVYTNLIDMKKLSEAIPDLKRKKIGQCVLNNNDGVILNTPTNAEEKYGVLESHHSWWKQEGCNFTDRFIQCNESI